VPADGFYEWKAVSPKTKQPYAFATATGQPLAFAGLWEAWKEPDGGWLINYSVVTTEPNELTAKVLSRLPSPA
jgi:putative SOS response-associated peptidase YedK